MRELFTENELQPSQQDEGQFLEFKSLWDMAGGTRKVLDRRTVRDKIAEYWRLSQRRWRHAVAGRGRRRHAIRPCLPPGGRRPVPGRARARLRPAVAIRHQRMTFDGKEIIAIQAGIEPEAVMVDGDGFPYRVGDQVRLEPQEIINRASRHTAGWATSAGTAGSHAGRPRSRSGSRVPRKVHLS